MPRASMLTFSFVHSTYHKLYWQLAIFYTAALLLNWWLEFKSKMMLSCIPSKIAYYGLQCAQSCYFVARAQLHIGCYDTWWAVHFPYTICVTALITAVAQVETDLGSTLACRAQGRRFDTWSRTLAMLGKVSIASTRHLLWERLSSGRHVSKFRRTFKNT